MKIGKNKSKQKETNSGTPSNKFNVFSSISISPSHFVHCSCLFSFLFLAFFSKIFVIFSRDIKMRWVCVDGNEKERESVDNIFFSFSHDRLHIYIHTMQY